MTAHSRVEPMVDGWYWSYGELFQIVALDEHDGSIEIRFEDGDVAELTNDEWSLRGQAGSLHSADPPLGRRHSQSGWTTAAQRVSFRGRSH